MSSVSSNEGPPQELHPDRDFILRCIREKGVVGTDLVKKLKGKWDTIIADAADSEPILAGSSYLLKHDYLKILKGLNLLIEAWNAGKAIIAVKEEDFSGTAEIMEIIRGMPFIEIRPTDPVNNLNENAVVLSVETIKNIYEAVVESKPVTRHILTCAGAVKEPSVVSAGIGTTLSEVIDLCGGPTIDEFSVVVGGPLQGEIETDLEAPVTKTTRGIIVLPSDHKLIEAKRQSLTNTIRKMMAACSGCGLCTAYCPSHLLGYNFSPHQIVRQICYGLDTENLQSAFFCTECGLCEYYACPMGLSPRALIAELKKRLAERGLKPPILKPSPVEPSDLREGRRIPVSRILQRLQLEEYADAEFRYRENGNPDRIELLLDQHNGRSANPVVRVGQMVTEGMEVAEGLHSGISGRVEIIDRDRIIIVG